MPGSKPCICVVSKSDSDHGMATTATEPLGSICCSNLSLGQYPKLLMSQGAYVYIYMYIYIYIYIYVYMS